MPLLQQLKLYASASELVFTEGSAIHALQLLGRIEADITVINRRPKSVLAEHLIKLRVKSLKYIEVGVNLIYGCRLSGQEAPETGLAIPSQSELFESLANILGEPPKLDRSTLLTAVARDLQTWLAYEATQERFHHERYDPILAQTMKKAQIGIDVSQW
jgi:hypothetical protein